MMDRAESVLEERLGFLFQPDVLIPAQYFDTLRTKTGMEPEKRLMLAVLEDAVRCFQDNVPTESDAKKKLFREAEEWFLTKDDDAPFSFDNVCEALGLDPEYVRRGLLRWKPREPVEKTARVHLQREWQRKDGSDETFIHTVASRGRKHLAGSTTGPG